jgi:small basic protein (TIGR04137 family)
MSVHKSLKSAGGLQRARNVFTRAERVAMLLREGRLKDGDDVIGLPKTKVPKMIKKSKAKKKKEDETAVEEGAEATTEQKEPSSS